MPTTRRDLLAAVPALVAVPLAVTSTARAAELPTTVTLDWAYYNPVSLVLKSQGLLEQELAQHRVEVRWVQSLGSNKALEFLNAGSLDFGSTAGAAALLGRINGNPIKSVYVYSKPEWTALVTRPDTGIAAIQDLKGRSVAATKGTDPYIFLLRALAANGLSQDDVQLVLLQHDQGKQALERGDVDAWAGLDPMMAQTELQAGSRLFFRDADANSWGVLNVREALAAEHPELVDTVIAAYEKGRRWALEHPQELSTLLATTAKLSPAIAARQLERTDLSHARIGADQRATIVAAGEALQAAGVIKADVDVAATTDALIEPRFTAQLAAR